jgi:hypothetical protein
MGSLNNFGLNVCLLAADKTTGILVMPLVGNLSASNLCGNLQRTCLLATSLAEDMFVPYTIKQELCLFTLCIPGRRYVC